MNDVFGFSTPYPPYEVIGISKEGFIEIKKIENWEEYLTNTEYDKYYIFYRCRADNTGTCFYDRVAREGYEQINNDHRQEPWEFLIKNNY